MQVAVADPGMVLYCLSSTKVLSLGLTSLSSEESPSVRDLPQFAGSTFFSACTIP